VHASPFDFVSALSAEESCPLCSELHATVDQCACVSCGTKTCPDCASLRPDASWVCASCVVASPGLAVLPSAAGSAPLWQRVRKVHIALTERALFRSLQPSALVHGLQTLRAGGRAVSALVLALWLGVWSALAPWLARRSASAQVYLARLRTQLRRQQRLQLARARYLSSSLVVTLRGLQWRQHASSLLIATAILIAVARSQTSADGR
jgi:hypothetical protein